MRILEGLLNIFKTTLVIRDPTNKPDAPDLCLQPCSMDSTKVMSLLETLDDEIDDLEESLQPLLKSALSETASKLPLLDKAKLYVLVTYAIESMLFCKFHLQITSLFLIIFLAYLRLNGIKAREHPVFKELTRVKQYFDKIKAIETPVERNMAVDKAAAARFIKAGLVSFPSYSLHLAVPTPADLYFTTVRQRQVRSGESGTNSKGES